MSITSYEKNYADLVRHILEHGHIRQTRNAKTKSVFGTTLIVDSPHMPLLCGRRLYPQGIVGELAAMLKGPKSLKDFEAFGCNYWKLWANEDGSLDVDYGNAWLDFNGVNQLKELVAGIKKDPHGRRHIVTGWRPDRLKDLSLPCCHLLYQWYVVNGKLEMIWYQRSVDTMIGLPSDVIVAWVWNHLVANECSLVPGKITMMLGDTHIYEPHLDQAILYVQRAAAIEARLEHVEYPLPCLVEGTMFDFNPSKVQWPGYLPMSSMKFELLA